MDISVIAAFVGFFAMVLAWMITPQRTLTSSPSPCAQGEGRADTEIMLRHRVVAS